MLNSPRRQRVINYNKQFRNRGAFTSRDESIHSVSSLNSGNPQFSFNVNRNSPLQNFSTQVQHNTLIDQRSMFTINPQESKKRQYASVGGQLPLKNRHFSRRKQFIDPQLLMNPRLHDSSDKQLVQRQDSDFDVYSPGNIRTQKPLQKQTKSNISVPFKDPLPSEKVENNQKNFKDIVKSQYISFNNEKSRKLPTFSRNKNIQPQTGDKNIKKGSDIQINSSNLFYQNKITSKNQSKTFDDLTHLLSQNNVGKLKQQINQLVQQKAKNKPKINSVNQSLIEQDSPGSQSNFINESRKFKSNYLFGQPDTLFSQAQKFNQSRHQQDVYSQRDRRHGKQYRINAFSSPKMLSGIDSKNITISYKTSLGQLRNIYKNVGRKQNLDIQVLVPKVLMQFYLDKNIQKIDLYNKARHIFASLGIPAQSISVKRYSNCIVIISKNICIMWHYDGKIYLGGWQIKYLDEGVKHGLGLQWTPNKYVYYGQYVQSKKTGLGVIKTKDQTFIGYWEKGKRSENGHLINKNGQVFHPKVSMNQETNKIEYEDTENDSFM